MIILLRQQCITTQLHVTQTQNSTDENNFIRYVQQSAVKHTHSSIASYTEMVLTSQHLHNEISGNKLTIQHRCTHLYSKSATLKLKGVVY